MRKYLLIVSLSFFCVPLFARASVVINEIAWMGMPPNLSSDEWIELYNDGADAVDMCGWTLAAEDGTPSITLAGTVGGGERFLLERTDDSSVPAVLMDQSYTGDLGNGGETLMVKDQGGNIVDTVVGGANWENIGGNNDTKETPQRSGSGWVTAPATPESTGKGPQTCGGDGDDTGGNDGGGGDDDAGDGGDNNNDPPTPAPLVDIVITEIMYDLPGSDSEREWIEVYNDDTVPADLASWKLFEAESNHGLTAIQGSGTLAPGEYAVIADNAATFLSDHSGFSGLLFDSSFSLSNGKKEGCEDGGETITLRNPDLVDRDSVAYQGSWGACGDGHSLARIENVWVYAIPTPGSSNTNAQFDPPPEEEEDNLPSEDNDDDEDSKGNGTEDTAGAPSDGDDAAETATPGTEHVGLFSGSAQGVPAPPRSAQTSQNIREEDGEVLSEFAQSTSSGGFLEEERTMVPQDDDGGEGSIGVWLLALGGVLVAGVAGVLLFAKPRRSGSSGGEGADDARSIADGIEIEESQ